ncbi:MAG: hypothetical protein MR426_14230 [Clostridiales bacterium]|nr:hypothetical protein [Clostridiales bacterium]
MKNAMQLLEAVGQIQDAYIIDAHSDIPKLASPRKRFLLIAAVVAALLALAGCAMAIHYVWAESPFTSLPRLTGEDIHYEEIELTITGVSPTGIGLMCTIKNEAFPEENQDEAQNAIVIINGPFYLEKKTETGWEELPKRIEDATWQKQEFITGGQLDLGYSWGLVYGHLNPGTYRLTTTVVEGQPEVHVEFDIADSSNLTNADAIQKCNDAIDAILNRECYHVYLSQLREFGEIPEGIRMDDGQNTSYSEFWKSGEDYLEFFAIEEGHIVDGEMKKDGVKYRLDNETEYDSKTPVAGWSVWPALDDNRLAWWAAYYEPNSVLFPEGIGVISDEEITFQRKTSDENRTEIISFRFDEAGNLKQIVETSTRKEFYAENAFVPVTGTMTIEICDTDDATISKKIADQDVNFYRDFSWEKDRKERTPLNVAFQNTTVCPVTNAPEAIAQAVKECNVEYTKIVVYRDEAAGMWKVEFQILYGHGGYQYVYLNNDGITQMIANAGAKVWVPGE